MMTIATINGGPTGIFTPASRSITYSLSMYALRLNAADYLQQYQVAFCEPRIAGEAVHDGFQPSTTGGNRFGDHACTHTNLKGTMLVVPDEFAVYGRSNHVWREKNTQVSYLSSTVNGSLTKTGTYNGGNLYTCKLMLYPVTGSSVSLPYVVRTVVDGDISYDNLATETYTCVGTVVVSAAGQYAVLKHHYVVDELNASSVTYADRFRTYFFMKSGSNWYVYCTAWYATQAEAENAKPTTYFGRGSNVTTSQPDGDLTSSADWQKLASLCTEIELDDEFDPIQVYGELANVAVQDAKMVDINSLQYVRELTKMSELLSSFTGLYGKLSLKAIAAAYLGYHYGLRLFASDSVSIFDAIRQSFSKEWGKTWSVLRARSASSFQCIHPCVKYGTAQVQTNYKIYYDQVDNAFKAIIKWLDDWDFSINASNVWDMIPFSFVVDWFVGIGDYLEAYDNSQYLSRLDVLGTVRSRRVEFPSFDCQVVQRQLNLKYSLGGEFHLVKYARLLSPTVYYPRATIDTDWSLRGHVLEATALLVQNFRK